MMKHLKNNLSSDNYPPTHIEIRIEPVYVISIMYTGDSFHSRGFLMIHHPEPSPSSDSSSRVEMMEETGL
ncbi:hypothetical protein PGTUg99_035745 [Puccinia graminis f. sp. tritici]|uniref:Uncharacterized protein n=1 Tax=Puccinia graminis f. sp. tritici TaxID=56615 RepID=A0A5B0RQL4_PUCGR|nr:hypothetical protein PGTUg99_035745 [Puccinia graminis f. sp. tritici]